MKTDFIKNITHEINVRAKAYDIGELQKIRKEILGLKRLASQDVFTSATTFEDWAFHYGGRKELQFNIGLEDIKGDKYIRFGVAFSLECSQSLPSIDILIPKIELFNDYVQSNFDNFADMRMWHYFKERSSDYVPSPIPPELVTEGAFIFLGVKQSIDDLNYDLAIEAMNRLMPLYLYTESNGEFERSNKNNNGWSFNFKPGCTAKASLTKANLKDRKLAISLRHNVIQEALYNKLSNIYGRHNVGTEILSGKGGSVDLVVRYKEDEFWFYEIKTEHTAKACIRQAIGQLLEYSFWPNNKEASRLVVVGEPVLDKEANQYIKYLKKRFELPIDYETIKI